MRFLDKLTFLGVSLLTLVAFAFAGAVTIVAFIEWMSGCGQLYHLADGSTRVGECVVLTWLEN